MKRNAWLLALCLLAGPALADNVRFDRGLVNSGDDAGKVTQVAGSPDRVVQLESEQGGNIGERWEYYRPNKTIQITFREGRVTTIRENFN